MCNDTVHQSNLSEDLKMNETLGLREKEEKQRLGNGDYFKGINKDSELPEECYHGLEDLPWNLNSLEQSLYISLPEWIQRALLCNLAEQFGIWTFHNNILPCRLISYILLPYTLPTAAIGSFIYRFLCWAKHIFHHAVSAGRDFKQDMTVHLRPHLRRLVPNRFLLLQFQPLVSKFALFLAPWSRLQPLVFHPLSIFHSFSFLFLSVALRFLSHCVTTLTMKNQEEHDSQTQQLSKGSVLCFQLSGWGEKSPDDIINAGPPSSTFFLQLSLELEMDSHSEALQPRKNKLDFQRRISLNSEWQMNTDKENLSSPCISYMDVQEED